MAETSCPFVGLLPFTAAQSRFFFGRERETRLVINNLFASRLTLLYGPSGVGKSSLLGAGVTAQLAEEAREDGRPEQLIVYLKEWQGDVMARFRVAVEKAVTATWPEADLPAAGGMGIAGWLGTIAEEREVEILVLLDQFEEYFLYQREEAAVVREPFARELAAALKTRALPVSFLLALRDDALARLDRFKVLIPNLFANYLRLEPLSEVAAEMAIREPIREHNQSIEGPAITIEDDLVAAVLEQVRKGEVEVGPGGRGRVAGKPAGVEAPYLQLVMTRIWEKEQEAGSAVLRAATLESLGGAETIVRDHLGEVMAALSEKERGICVDMFQHLVTPSGAKIAHSAADLAQWAGEPKERVEHLLSRLSGTPMRILVSVAPVDAVGAERYEIYHDALGQAMLDWRERRVAEEQRAEIRRWRRLVVALVVAMVVALVAMGFAWMKSEDAKEKAALAAEQERKAQQSARRATAKAKEVAILTQRFQAALAEKEEKEAQVLELQGKSDEAEKLRADSAEREQRMREILDDLGVGEEEPDLVAAMESRLQTLTGERDKERARAERATAESNEQRSRAERAEGQLADALVRVQELERQVDDLKPAEMENDLGMRFRRIRAGTFQMGSPPEELDRHRDETLHKVTLTRDFWMAETEVTQGQWKALMVNNPSRFQDCGAHCPVHKVNWFEALELANRLSKREGLGECYTLTCSGTLGKNFACSRVDFVGLDCQGYRLPTEAEWEYAARAGTTTPFWTGDNLTTEQANYDGNYPYGENPKGIFREKPMAARSFDPNPWGLYEVHGNVWEWVWDWYGALSGDSVIDPTGPERGSYRVVRGGSWFCNARYCRAANRSRNAPGYCCDHGGFRLVRTYP